MSALEVHLLAGDASLLMPDLVDGQDLALLFGTEYRCVPANWLSTECGRYSHNFLADNMEDNRIEVFARSLMTDYARGPRPFLIIPELVDEPSVVAPTVRKDWGIVLVALAAAIRSLGGDCTYHLHLLAAPFVDEDMTRLERLRNWLEDLDLKVWLSEDAVKDPALDTQYSNRFERNYLSGQLAKTIAKRCDHRGIVVSDMNLLKKFTLQCLEQWASIGLRPSLPVEDIRLDCLAEAVLAQALVPAGQQVPR